jgi:predicted CXXCH cytochrome family protein
MSGAAALLPCIALLFAGAGGASDSALTAVLSPAVDTGLPAGTAAVAGFSDAQCSSCHTVKAPELSHPVDVEPGMQVPAFLPLSEEGRINCLTCHDSSLAAHDDPLKRSQGLLRGSLRAGALCSQCHGDGSLASAGGSHAFTELPAHLEQSMGALGPIAGTSQGIDRESRTCIGCHDGTTASNMVDASHPFGVPYAGSLPVADGGSFRLTPAYRLDARIRLFDGAIGCGSCHSPYSKREKMVVMRNDYNQLCASCHQPAR